MAETDWSLPPYQEWRPTRDTLHMYTQVIGKLRLALSPFEPQWANVPLYLTARGLTTSPMPVGLRTVEAQFDFFDHALTLTTSDGAVERRELGGPVADFYHDVMKALRRLDVDVELSVLPSEVPNPVAFPDDRTHATYEPQHAARFFTVLSMIDVVLKQHRAGFRGRTSPVHFFWGTFDMALARFSGRPVTPPDDAGVIFRYGGNAEQICAGWWPGDEHAPYAAFYAYGFPKPDGLERAAIAPAGAAWDEAMGEFLLRHDDVAAAADPRQAILDFFASTYAAAAERMDWDPELTKVAVPPSPVSARRA